MKYLQYTTASRIWMFQQYIKEVGPWRPTWSWSRPTTMTTKEYGEITLKIHLEYEKQFPSLVTNRISSEYVAQGKSGAIEQQLQWTITPQKTQGTMTRKLRLAAYEAGFLSMTNIVYLEHLEQSKL